MSVAARKVPPEEEFNSNNARRPTRAGVSGRSGSAPSRRGARLSLVTDEDFDFEPVGPKRTQAKTAPAPAEPAAPVRGNTALQPDPEAAPAPGAAPRVERDLRLAPPAPVTVARMPFVVLSLVLIVGGIIGLLLLNTQINQDAFKLQDLREKQAQLDTAEQQLNKELAEKEAPGNLAAEAARQGMVPAGTPAYITLPDGRILGVPQPAGQSRR